MADYLAFSGAPVTDLQQIDDPKFIIGPVFCAAMKMLSGLDPQCNSVQKNLSAMRLAVTNGTRSERSHAKAVEHMVLGEYSNAAKQWDAILADHPEDLLAQKCAHETWFLLGDVPSMLATTTAVVERLSADSPAYMVAAAQHGFALEESGAYQAAEGWSRLALEMEPTDCWALHCLAHVYEAQNRHCDAMDLLEVKKVHWTRQNLLSAHIWWHLTLRLIEMEDYNGAMAVFDDTLSAVPASNRFRLTDGTSLLWRLELAGVEVGDRWQLLAEKWGENAQLHTNPFLDLHAALAFTNCSNSAAASMFFESLEASFVGSGSELAQTFNELVKPLVKALRFYKDDPAAAAKALEPLLPHIHKLGGSFVQRELVERSYCSALLTTRQALRAEAFLQPKLACQPNSAWLLRSAARAKALTGDNVSAALLNRRADLMFKRV